MGIHIKPRDFEVPEGNPFKNDLLGRRESVEVLTHLVDSLEGPCVLAVDAEWGYGKTTFLRIWAQHLRNQGFPIIKFNAWETDFSGDPFVALSTELREGLQEYSNESMAQKIKDATKAVLRQTVPTLIRLGTASIPLPGTEADQFLVSYVEERLSAYQKAKESVPEFRHVLQGMAAEVSKAKDGRPLIVMIDELDRCRPSYAVELLEVAKHLFAVDHIVFVLAVNRSELAHSIKALYGEGFDAQGYLRRFFDVDFVLPVPDREAFIKTMLDTIRIDDYFERTQDRSSRQNVETARKLLQGFFYAPDLSLRRIAQAIYRLGLVFASLRSDNRSFALSAVVCLVLRTIEPDLYHLFVRGQVSDLDVVDKVFSRPGAKTLQQEPEGWFFEAMIICGPQEEALSRSESINSPLLERYKTLVNSEASDNALLDPNRRRANEVNNMVQRISNGIDWNNPIGFRHSIQRIELLSASLIDEPVTKQEN